MEAVLLSFRLGSKVLTLTRPLTLTSIAVHYYINDLILRKIKFLEPEKTIVPHT